MEEFKRVAKENLEAAEKQLRELEKLIKVLQAQGQISADIINKYYDLKRQVDNWKQALKVLED